MNLCVEKARYVPRYKIEVAFNDGTARTVDFEPFLRRATNPLFVKFRSTTNFKQFHVDHGDLMWGDFEMIFPIEDFYRGEIS
jgi:hypothetical protein